MKRILASATGMLLAVVFMLSTFACGQTASQPQSADSQPAAAVTETRTPEETAPAPTVPENGKPDKTGYPNLDVIEVYRKTDWTANWIWTPSCSDDSYVAFRKTFTLDETPTSAVAYISAVDKYTLWVNGEQVVIGGSLNRGPSPFDSYFDTVDISQLHSGENTIAVLVAFNGRSGDGSIVPVNHNEEGDEFNQAGLLFELYVGDTVIASDATWKATRHQGYKNRVTAGKDYVRYTQSSQLAECNVFYMASDDIGSFQRPDYDDSTWENAALIARPGDLPFGDLYAAVTKPPKTGLYVEFSNAADYLDKPLTENTTLALKLPGNRQFIWYIELDAPAGKTLTFYTDTYTDRQDAPNFKDTYITKDGLQSYENYPWRTGSTLYIEAEAGVTFKALWYRLTGYNGEWVGSFTSDDPALDQIWQESLNTIAICMRDAFMDCPDRERGPYMGDASNQIDAALYSYDQGGLDLIKKSILACVAWTTDSDTIPSRAPSVKPQEIPNQSLAFGSSAYHYWLHSGDAETMAAYYRVFVKYLKLFEMDANGLPMYRAGSWQWNDWGNKIDTELLQAGFYFYALTTARRLADDLGIAEDNAFLDERIESMRQNWRAAYTTEEGFRSSKSKYVDDRANALLALSGLAEPQDYEQIINVLTTTYEASPFTEKYLLEALCVMGREDLAMERIKLRYAPMLTDKWDTLWELYNDDTGTYNHGWNAGPLYILSKYVAGVRPTEPGWKSYEIAPSTALANYSCTVWTPNGNITVEKAGNALTIMAINGNGTVVLPNGQTETITAAGTYTYEIAE